jgi:cobalt-zinc-cadmium efflux system protein
MHEHVITEIDNSSKTKIRLVLTMILNFLITAAELIGGLFSGSLSLISDALHNFSDGISIIVSYTAIKISAIPKNERFTFGYKRAEIFAALINTSVLVVISLFLIKEAIHKFINPQHIEGSIVIIVASIGLIANIIGTLLLKKDSKENINIRSSYLHLLSDAFSSLAVIIGGVLIWAYDIYWIDPILTILISLYIIYESYEILKKTVDIFMMKAPNNFSVQEISECISKLNGVSGLHHIHYWIMNDKQTHFEAHIEVDDKKLSELDGLRKQIEELLHHKFNIEHITLQLEYSNCEVK